MLLNLIGIVLVQFYCKIDTVCAMTTVNIRVINFVGLMYVGNIKIQLKIEYSNQILVFEKIKIFTQ